MKSADFSAQFGMLPKEAQEAILRDIATTGNPLPTLAFSVGGRPVSGTVLRGDEDRSGVAVGPLTQIQVPDAPGYTSQPVDISGAQAAALEPAQTGALTHVAKRDPSTDIMEMLKKFVPEDDSSSKYLALAAGFGRPSGSFGETMGNVAGALMEQKQNQQKLRAQYVPLIMQQVAAQQAREEAAANRAEQIAQQQQFQAQQAAVAARDRAEQNELNRQAANERAAQHNALLQALAGQKPPPMPHFTTGADGMQYAVDPTGKATPVTDATGKPLMAKPSDIPKLSPDQRWNDKTQEVEVIPGSKLWQTQKSAHAKDFGTVQNAVTSMNQSIAKVDEILDPKRESDFNGNFGGYNAVVSQYLPGGTTDMRKKIESVKSDLKMAGLNIIRAGGSVGAMTEKEWPIVEGMISRIDPTLSESAARQEFEKVKAYMQRIKENAENLYRTEWEGSPHYRGSTAAPAAAEPAPSLPSPADIQAEIARRAKKG